MPSLSPNRGGKWGTHDLALLEAAVSSQADWATASRGLVWTGNAISPPLLSMACWPPLVLLLPPDDAERTRDESRREGKERASEVKGVNTGLG